MDNQDFVKKYEDIAHELRKKIIEISFHARAHHLGSALSCVDILTALYFHTMKIDPNNPNNPERDWFVLSKGHAAQALYVTLAKRGFFSENILFNFLKNGSNLGDHPDKDSAHGIEMSTGSLGHGLPVGIGVALSAKKDNLTRKIFVLLGDGECNEGVIWEAALFASQQKLDNLTTIIDYNKFQSLGKNNEILNLEPLAEKFKTFGWEVWEIDGHNMNEILNTFDSLPLQPDKPNMIIAHTIKGKGISFLENRLESHYLILDEDQYKQAMNEL